MAGQRVGSSVEPKVNLRVARWADHSAARSALPTIVYHDHDVPQSLQHSDRIHRLDLSQNRLFKHSEDQYLLHYSFHLVVIRTSHRSRWY